jgi:hypothetical protein
MTEQSHDSRVSEPRWAGAGLESGDPGSRATNPDDIATMRVCWVRFDGTAPEASASQSQRKPPSPALPLRGRGGALTEQSHDSQVSEPRRVSPQGTPVASRGRQPPVSDARNREPRRGDLSPNRCECRNKPSQPAWLCDSRNRSSDVSPMTTSTGACEFSSGAWPGRGRIGIRRSGRPRKRTQTTSQPCGFVGFVSTERRPKRPPVNRSANPPPQPSPFGGGGGH